MGIMFDIRVIARASMRMLLREQLCGRRALITVLALC
jgi:hypothetical protein